MAKTAGLYEVAPGVAQELRNAAGATVETVQRGLVLGVEAARTARRLSHEIGDRGAEWRNSHTPWLRR
ncbi:MAG TPA: hypothetical protein VLB73_00710 [Patescibacteria group bacterium]|nr:hypothetical protein [Patescibacteria group bacterium]